MALTINISKLAAVRAFDAAIASLKRSANKTGINPAMAELIEGDIREYRTAIDTLIENTTTKK